MVNRARPAPTARSHAIDRSARSGNSVGMTTTVKMTANGQMVLPAALRKSKHLKSGGTLRVTQTGESILLTPVYPPTEEELAAVIETAGGPGPVETPRTRQQVKAAIGRVRARKA